jgi:hypothetical protein
MNTKAAKTSENERSAIAHAVEDSPKANRAFTHDADHRPAAIAQRRLQGLADRSRPVQRLAQWQAKADASAPVVQRVTINKVVWGSARRHYFDGWGALYGIQSDRSLRSEFNTAGNLGEYSVSLGEQYHPGENKTKECTIRYRNEGRGGDNVDCLIRHCGPG